MITNILVITDFSKVAGNALEYALFLSEKVATKVHVMHVDTMSTMEIPYPVRNYTALYAHSDSETRELNTY